MEMAWTEGIGARSSKPGYSISAMGIPTIGATEWRAARRDHRRAVVVTSGVALLLLTPGSGVPDLPGSLPAWVAAFGDKIVHAVLFFVETLSLHQALRHSQGRRALALAGLSSFAFALFTEIAQLVVPFRDGSLGDLLADGVGIALALPLAAKLAAPAATATSTIRTPETEP